MSGIKNDIENQCSKILSENDLSNQNEYKKPLDYVRQNYMKIYIDQRYLRIKLEPLREILDSDDLNVENEEVVFASVRSWSLFNVHKDETQIMPLLKAVRYSLLPIKYLFDEVEPFIYPIEEFRHIFLDVLRSYNLNDRKIDVTVQSLNLSNCSLSTEASLKNARQYAAAVVVGKGKMSFLFVLGGRGKEGDLDSVERWDPLSRKWTGSQNMLQKRTGLASAILNDDIYVLGGKSDSYYTDTMEAYNLQYEIWEMKAKMKEARAHFCVAVFKEYLYAVAGSTGNHLQINTVEKYDPYDDSRITIANVMTRGQVGVSSLGNRLICAGGKHSKLVMEYDDEKDKWLKLKDLHMAHAGYLLELPKEMNHLEFN